MNLWYRVLRITGERRPFSLHGCFKEYLWKWVYRRPKASSFPVEPLAEQNDLLLLP